MRVLYSLEISLFTLTKPAPATQARYCVVIKKEDDFLRSVNKRERFGNKHITSIWDNNKKQNKYKPSINYALALHESLCSSMPGLSCLSACPVFGRSQI